MSIRSFFEQTPPTQRFNRNTQNPSFINQRRQSVLPEALPPEPAIAPTEVPPERQALIDAVVGKQTPTGPQTQPMQLSMTPDQRHPLSAGFAGMGQSLANAYLDRKHKDKMGIGMPEKPNWAQRQLGLGVPPKPKPIAPVTPPAIGSIPKPSRGWGIF